MARERPAASYRRAPKQAATALKGRGTRRRLGGERTNRTAVGGGISLSVAEPIVDIETQPDPAALRRSHRATIADAEPILVRQLVGEFTRRDMDAAALVRGLGFGLEDLTAFEFRVSYAQTSRLIRRATLLLPQQQLGLLLARASSLASWGLGLIGLMASADTVDMLDLATEYLRSTDHFVSLHRSDGEGGIELIAEPRFPDPDVSAVLVENAFAALVRLSRFVAGPNFAPLSVGFGCAAPPAAAALEEYFRCPVQFGQGQNRIVFPAAPQPIASADLLTAQLCRQLLAQRQRGERAASELEEAIVRALRADLRRPPPVKSIAQSVNLSERTLRRRLQQSGLSYAALLDNERMRRAVALLAESERSLVEVAEQSGFTDTRSLRRAIKRWTGRTPTQVRRGEG